MRARRHAHSPRSSVTECQPGMQRHVRVALEDGRADLGDVEPPEVAAVDAVARARRPHDPAAVALGERHVPVELPAEPHPLLRRSRPGRVEDGEVDLGAVRGDVAEPGRSVLHRVGEHGGQPHGPVHARDGPGGRPPASSASAALTGDRRPDRGLRPACRPARRRRTDPLCSPGGRRGRRSDRRSMPTARRRSPRPVSPRARRPCR